MIDYSVLETKTNGQLTTTSVKEFIYRAGGDNCWNAFTQLANDKDYKMSYETFYRGLCTAYGYADYLNTVEACVLFSECENDWYNYSTKKQKKFFDSLPENVTVYRGCTKDEADSGEYGISWTTDKKIAEFFAHEYIRRDTDNGVILEATINKANINGVILDRDESEVIITCPELICTK